MKIRFTLVILTAFAGLMLSARTIKFRSGNVLAAELSSAKISVFGAHRDAPLTIPSNPVYAVVSVKLDSGRSISIFDYTLDAFGNEVPCVAIRTGKNFQFTTDTITHNGVIQLLFITSMDIVGKLANAELTLKSKLPPNKMIYSTAIPFSMIKNKAVMAPAAVPAAGAFASDEEKK